MARSLLTEITQDIIDDGGSVLWSLVRGEQLEFPITLNFISDATAGYAYEAVVAEGNNLGDGERPTTVKTPSPSVTTLIVRVPTKRGTWSAATAYNKEEIVLYNSVYYKLLTGSNRVNSTPPSSDPLWVETVLNKVYLQFPSTLGASWSVLPAVKAPVYGFFELRVTEPFDSIFMRTWKPIRGMVEILFSPTEMI